MTIDTKKMTDLFITKYKLKTRQKKLKKLQRKGKLKNELLFKHLSLYYFFNKTFNKRKQKKLFLTLIIKRKKSKKKFEKFYVKKKEF